MSTVLVCTDCDRECGDHERGWCSGCPKRRRTTLADRMLAAMELQNTVAMRASKVAELVAEHDAVMAQMAEALRDYYSILEGIAPWMEIEDINEYLKLKASRNAAQTALSAYLSLGDKP